MTPERRRRSGEDKVGQNWTAVQLKLLVGGEGSKYTAHPFLSNSFAGVTAPLLFKSNSSEYLAPWSPLQLFSKLQHKSSCQSDRFSIVSITCMF